MKLVNFVAGALSALMMLAAAPVSFAHGDHSDRAVLRSLQNQINALRGQITKPQFQVVFRDSQRTVHLAPGGTEVFALGCQAGEVVVTGGYNSNPSEILQIVLNTPFFDGVHSGWRVDFNNPTDATVTVDLRVTVECTKGTGRGE